MNDCNGSPHPNNSTWSFSNDGKMSFPKKSLCERSRVKFSRLLVKDGLEAEVSGSTASDKFGELNIDVEGFVYLSCTGHSYDP